MVKKAGAKIRFDYMDNAQKHNEDGYGVAWYEDGMVKTYKTFNYNTFKGVVAALRQYDIVVHLRNTTKGQTDYNSIHPFEIPSGVMFHNGTIFKFGNTKQSDTAELASLITECDYKYVEDIMPLIQIHVKDKINRLVFFEDNGRITIVNQELGIIEDDTWYSNDYHLKDDGWCRNSYYSPTVVTKKKDEPKLYANRTHKVFVYGTLKRGYGNHRLLENAIYLGKAKTKDRWNMIGKTLPFPYLIERDDVNGKRVEGEVYLVSSTELQQLDRLEGVPTHYRKEDIDINYVDDLSEDNVTVYVKTLIDSGYVEKHELIQKWEA